MKNERLEIRLSAEEKKTIRNRASEYGLTVSEYLRALVNQDLIKGGLK